MRESPGINHVDTLYELLRLRVVSHVRLNSQIRLLRIVAVGGRRSGVLYGPIAYVVRMSVPSEY